MTEGGYYKIKVDSNSVPIVKYIEIKQENSRLKTILETILNTAKQISIQFTDNLISLFKSLMSLSVYFCS